MTEAEAWRSVLMVLLATGCIVMVTVASLFEQRRLRGEWCADVLSTAPTTVDTLAIVRSDSLNFCAKRLQL